MDLRSMIWGRISFQRRRLGPVLFHSAAEFEQLFLDLIHAGNSSLMLLLSVPWHLRLAAQSLLLIQFAQIFDFLAQFLYAFANFFRF